MGFQQVERRVKDTAEDAGRLGRERGKRSRERKKQGKAGWPRGRSSNGEDWIQDLQNNLFWGSLLYGGSRPLRRGQPQLELCF